LYNAKAAGESQHLTSLREHSASSSSYLAHGVITSSHTSQKRLVFRLRPDYGTSPKDTAHPARRGHFGRATQQKDTRGIKERGTMDKKLVEIVQQRAGDYCEVCGAAAQESMALHHRKLKSRGGKDTAGNLIWVHHKCHNLGTDSIHLNPEWAEQHGYMVPSWQNPQEVPISLPSGGYALLLDDGTKKILEEKAHE
jgi:hypothetical protein